MLGHHIYESLSPQHAAVVSTLSEFMSAKVDIYDIRLFIYTMIRNTKVAQVFAELYFKII